MRAAAARVALLLLLLSPASACGGSGVNNRAALEHARSGGARAAVVSLNINNYGAGLTMSSMRDVAGYILDATNAMLAETERVLGEHFTVVPAASFGGSEAYLASSIGGPYKGTFVPLAGDYEMVNFSDQRPHLIKGHLPVAAVQQLAHDLDLDLVVATYSEWGVKTGSFIPTSKALSKNVMTIYAADGAVLFHGRRDVVGKKTLGAFSITNIDENSIFQWVDAYTVGITQMLAHTR